MQLTGHMETKVFQHAGTEFNFSKYKSIETKCEYFFPVLESVIFLTVVFVSHFGYNVPRSLQRVFSSFPCFKEVIFGAGISLIFVYGVSINDDYLNSISNGVLLEACLLCVSFSVCFCSCKELSFICLFFKHHFCFCLYMFRPLLLFTALHF